jgi:hypothetical protein
MLSVFLKLEKASSNKKKALKEKDDYGIGGN